MAGRPLSTKAASEAASEDRISQLPGDLKDRILDFLDTRSAARTALLSTLWKDAWFQHGRLAVADLLCSKVCTGTPKTFKNMMYPWINITLPEEFPTARNVEVMKLYGLKFTVPKQFDLAVLLMTKCPKLCVLEILPNEFISKDEIEAAAKSSKDPEYGFTDQDLGMLKTVKMQLFRALRLEILFIKAILLNSPVLEKLVIQESPYIDASVASKTVRKTLCFPRASPKAQVVFVEYKSP